MRKRNNKSLYENIMRKVAKVVKRTLNENEWYVPTDKRVPKGWEQLDREDDEPLYRDEDYNEYVRDEYGHYKRIENDFDDTDYIGVSGASWEDFKKEVFSDDWSGIDASNEISLGEYGLLVDNGSVSDSSAKAIVLNPYTNEYEITWIDLEQCAELLDEDGPRNTCDITSEEIQQTLKDANDGDVYAAIRLIDDVISYYGAQEII